MRSKSSRVTTVRRKSAYRPRIEVIENRLLLAVITVTSTGDAINPNDGVVTLREAITAANSNKNISDVVGVGAYGNDKIDFDIPGTGVQTIRPTSALPIITDPVTIDGYTQPGSAPNTNPVGQGLNGKLLIEIDGENAGDVRFGMLEFQTTHSVVRGLVINRTQGEKIGIDSVGTAGDIQIEGDYIGTDATGTADFAAAPNPNSNARDGISIGSRGNTIGGTTPAARNLISGNIGSIQVSYGVNDNSSSPLGIANFVQGNLIGTDRTGTVALGNGSGGVAGGSGLAGVGQLVVGGPGAGAANLISGNGGIGVHIINGVVQGNLIGTDVTGTLPLGNATGVQTLGNVVVQHNTIAFNTVAGVQFTDINDVPTMGNLIAQNSIFSNFGPGIGTSSYLNDSPDADGIQNYPLLTSVMPNGSGTRVQGTLASKSSSNYRLEFFASAERVEDAHDVSNFTMPGEFAQGRTYLGTIDVTTDATGMASFTANLAGLPAGQPYVTATATDITNSGGGPRNNTSPFSAVAVLGGPSFVVTNTNDSGLGSLREAIYNANLTPGAQTITFAIPATDPRHFYYRNDGVAGTVTTADIATTTATDDSKIADIDPDWPYSWYSIQPDHNLPKIVDTITIDGYSQPGSVQNTLYAVEALNTVLKIELDGSKAPGVGLNLAFFNGSIDSSNSRIDGLAINRFGGDGIALDTLKGGNTIAGSFIGTDVSGTLELGDGADGIRINLDNNNTIGGTTPDSRNLISGNESADLEAVGSLGNYIIGSLFGLSRDGQPSLPSGDSELVISPDSTALTASVSTSPEKAAALRVSKISPQLQLQTVGMFAFDLGFAALANVLNFLKPAATIKKGTPSPEATDYQRLVLNGPLFLSNPFEHKNSIRATADNTFLGVDFGADGVTPNDPEDNDLANQGSQNYPVLSSAVTAAATTVSGTLNSVPNTGFRLEFFSNAVGTNFRAGQVDLGTMDVTTDPAGNASFSFPSPVRVPVGQFVTALATRLSDGAPIQTSEFSAVIPVTDSTAAPVANLSVTQTASANPVAAGGDLTFTVTVANAGPGPATGVHLVVTPPAGATLVSATGGVMPVGGTLIFNVGAIGNGTSSTVTIVVRTATPGSFVSSATVTANESDPSMNDNSSTLAVTVVDLTPPTIINVLPPSTKDKKPVVVLTFSEDLDPARAALVANYRIVTAGRDKKFGTKDDKVIALRSVIYNPTTHKVTLLPRKRLAVATKYRLTVNGTSASGIEDLAGNLLDGDHDGRVSGNYVAIFKLALPKGRRR